MTSEERTRPRTFQRARRAAVSYRIGFHPFAIMGRSMAILVLLFPRLVLAAVPAYAVLAAPALLPATRTALPAAFPTVGSALSYLVFGSVAYYLLVGFCAGPVGDHLAGERTGIGGYFRSGSRSLLAAAGIAPALGLATALGLILFVLPGIVVFLSCYLAVPLAARDGLRPWPAVERSARLIGRSIPDLAGCLIFLGMVGPVLTLIIFGLSRPPGAGGFSTPEALVREVTYFLPFVLAAILPTVVFDELQRR